MGWIEQVEVDTVNAGDHDVDAVNKGVDPLRASSLAMLGLLVAIPAAAATLEVSVTGLRSTGGEVGCALYPGAAGFPMEPARAVETWRPAVAGSVVCVFEALEPGRYAVAVSHDLNGNRRTDANFLGMPTEDWGVSNNVRPTLRAPRFEESAIDIGDAAFHRIEVRLGR